MSEDKTADTLHFPSFEERVLALLDDVSSRLAALEGNVVRLEENVVRLEGHVVQLEGKVVQLEGKVVQLEGKVVQLEGKVVQLEGKVVQIDYETKPNWERLHTDFAELNAYVKTSFGNFNRKLDVINSELLQLKADQRELRVG